MSLLALAALALAGCSDTADEDEARDNLALWKEKGPSSYVYVIAKQCFCSDVYVEPVRVVVENGKVKSAIGHPSGTEHKAQTMTELLESVVHEAAKDDKFKARYDEKLGYLKYLSVDRSSDTTDDESTSVVSCFAEGSGDDLCAH